MGIKCSSKEVKKKKPFDAKIWLGLKIIILQISLFLKKIVLMFVLSIVLCRFVFVMVFKKWQYWNIWDVTYFLILIKIIHGYKVLMKTVPFTTTPEQCLSIRRHLIRICTLQRHLLHQLLQPGAGRFYPLPHGHPTRSLQGQPQLQVTRKIREPWNYFHNLLGMQLLFWEISWN